MCLDKVEKPIKKWGVGYKRVDKIDGQYYSYDCPFMAGFAYKPIGVWCKDPNTQLIEARDGTHYEPGFHISLNRRGTYDNHIEVKVRFKKAIAGKRNSYTYGDTVVAKEMMIIEEV